MNGLFASTKIYNGIGIQSSMNLDSGSVLNNGLPIRRIYRGKTIRTKNGVYQKPYTRKKLNKRRN